MIGGSTPSGNELILEVQHQCLTQVGLRLIETVPLAGHFQLEAAGHVPGMFVGDGCSETHFMILRKPNDSSSSAFGFPSGLMGSSQIGHHSRRWRFSMLTV